MTEKFYYTFSICYENGLTRLQYESRQSRFWFHQLGNCHQLTEPMRQNMNHLIAFRALLFQSKYYLIFKTDKISNILGLNLLKLKKFKLRPKQDRQKIKNKKDKFVKFRSGLISIPRASAKSVLDINCVDKVSSTSALEYFI